MKHFVVRTIGVTTVVGLLAGMGTSRAFAQSAPPGTTAQASAKPTSPAQIGLFKKAQAAVDADTARLTTVFKDIHQHPRARVHGSTPAGIVAKELTALGFEVKTGIGKTGVVGILRNGAGPTVMYRADMDANAVEEASGFDYASKVRVKRDDGSESPVAHMCGHGAHVTWMAPGSKQPGVGRRRLSRHATP